MTRRLAAAVALVVVGAVPAAAAERFTGLEAHIDMNAHVARGERAMVEFTLRNDSPDEIFILQWQTPLRALEHEIFDVRRNGEVVEYVGPHVKFGSPRPEHYIRLAAGEARTVNIDLGQLYDFSQAGEYSVQYRVNVQDAIKPHFTIEPAFIRSNRVSAAVDRAERNFRPRVAAAKPGPSGPYNRCSDTQIATIQQALSA
jgi:hypothetical protein